MVSNFPDEACCRATGNPMDNTLSKDETASFQVLSDGQAYFKPKGILNVLQGKGENKERAITDRKNQTKSRRLQGKIYRTNWSTMKAFHLLFYSQEFWIHSVNINAVFKECLTWQWFTFHSIIEHLFDQVLLSENRCVPQGWDLTSISFLFWRQKRGGGDIWICPWGTLLIAPWQTDCL